MSFNVPEFADIFNAPTPPEDYKNSVSPMCSGGNSNIANTKISPEGLRTPPVATKNISKNRSVGGAHSYKNSLARDHAGKNVKDFGTVISNESNGDILKKIYEKMEDIDQKYNAMVTMNKKKNRISTLYSSQEDQNSNFTPKQSVYSESKLGTERTVTRSYLKKVSIRQDTEDEDFASMDDMYTNQDLTIPKHTYQEAPKNEHAKRSSAGNRSPGVTTRGMIKAQRIQYSARSSGYRSEKNSGSTKYLQG